MNNKQIAEAIAEELFVNGQGDRADRLALMKSQGTDPERYLGGWSKSAAISVIEQALIKHQGVERSRSKKQKIEDSLKQSDLTAQYAERQDIEYGHHETIPRGEHVARRRG